MSVVPPSFRDATGDPAALATICSQVAEHGYAVVPAFMSQAAVGALAAECKRRDSQGEFAPAGVGRGERRVLRRTVRGDRILWLDEVDAAPSERPLRRAFDDLRAALNASLFLGLFDLEAHYAIYPPGASYARHRDRFDDERGPERVLSCVLYLNPRWTPADGGALRLHLDDAVRDVLPAAGTLVAFLSARFEHEVLPATRERMAVSGWFRRRA
jgi:SM-20-related protein